MVVDEYWLEANLVAIGRGGPVFADLENQAKLELPSARGFPSGTATVLHPKQVP